MKLDQFLIGLLLFSLIFVSGAMILYDSTQTYEVEADMDMFDGAGNQNTTNGTYYILDEMYNDMGSPAESRLLGNQSTEIGGEDEAADVSLIRGAFRTLKLIPNTFRLINSIIDDVAINLGIPSFFITFMKTAFALAIIFSIIFLIWRLRS